MLSENDRPNMPTTTEEKPTDQETKDLIDLRSIARENEVTPRTIQRWVEQRKIPVIRVSRRYVRFNRKAVRAALERFTVREVTA